MLLSLQTNEAGGIGKPINFYSFIFWSNWTCMTLSSFDIGNCRHSDQLSLESHLHNNFSFCQYKLLALLKTSWVFICNREFCWELSRKSQYLYSFDLSTLPAKLRSLEHTSSISLWSQLARFSTCVLYLGRSLLGSSWHCHFA